MTRAAVAAAVLLALPWLSPVARAVDVDWGQPTASAAWGERITFEQPVALPQGVRRIEVLVETPGAAGPIVEEVSASGTGRTTLRFSLELAEGHILPNTPVSARWRITAADGSEATGPAVDIRYEDTRFEWQTLEGSVVRVHWYQGSQAFGQRALEIGERAIEETSQLLGVAEDQPVDFYVYAEQDPFYDALGPGTRENVGGQANAEIRTLFALIPPAQIDDAWVGVVIPHELVHLVFDTAVRNPYHFPPRWLNEGLAVYLSEGFGPADRAAVQQAAADGTLIPLDGLTGQFPTTRDRFFLAYSESVGAVDYFIREHGQDALIQLVRSYETGLTDDEAFQQAIGLDVAGFDAAWRASLNAREPTQYGPRPAPPGPLPPGWAPADGSPQPNGSPSPGASPTAAPSPAPSANGGSAGGIAGLLVAALALILGLGALWLVMVRRRSTERAQVRQWEAWRAERTAAPARVAEDETRDPPGPPEAGR